MSLTASLRRIKQAGFKLRVHEDSLIVSNGNKLSESQRSWITQHKTDLINCLKVMDDPHLQEMSRLFDAEIVTVSMEKSSR